MNRIPAYTTASAFAHALYAADLLFNIDDEPQTIIALADPSVPLFTPEECATLDEIISRMSDAEVEEYTSTALTIIQENNLQLSCQTQA